MKRGLNHRGCHPREWRCQQTDKIIHIKDGLIERIEENLNHDSSPFGKNGFMK